MDTKKQSQSSRPKGVPHKITGYEVPLFSMLDEAAAKYPNNTFTIFQGASRTFREVKDAADKVAGFLNSKGVKKGDPVAIFLPNIPQFPEVYFGILKAGAVCVTCNPLYTADELSFQLRDCGARVVFCMDHPNFYPTAVKAVDNTGVDTVVICNIKSYLPRVKGFLGGLLGKIPKAEQHEEGHLFFDDIIKTATPLQIKLDLDPVKDLAMILYTSGTTGHPKGACLTHANLVYATGCLHEGCLISHSSGEEPERLRINGAHCFLGILPWYHIFGLWASLFWPCRTGNKVVCLPDPRAGKPPFSDALRAIEHNKVTLIPAVPTIFTALTNHPLINTIDLSSIIACFAGAAPLPTETVARFEKKTGAVVFEGYGMSELIPVSVNPTTIEGRRFGSVGLPAIGTEVKIVDIDTGTHDMPDGEEGEIAVSGPQLMKEYWQRPESNEADFRSFNGNRFFLTGDIGRFDEDGYLFITDRKKDMILVGGFNVYPAEVENALVSHPKVALAAVIGIPDEKGGEKVKAFIHIKPGVTATEEEILEYCKDTLAGYKRPKEIEFREELPTSIVGKIIRRKLKEENN
ncbi:MAG: long-chain fatty acid--CoA ligase [Deltaproteobacteria bacterium]|nr:long-chain fatty acid--CoA ligase [Deltaproteobacteria bacterium]